LKLYPENALAQLEYHKIKELLHAYCATELAKETANNLRIHTQLSYIQKQLSQTHEFKSLIQNSANFPTIPSVNLHKELKLLTVSNAVLVTENWQKIRRLLAAAELIFRWFNDERREAYPALTAVIANEGYNKDILKIIDDVLDEVGIVKDSASKDLAKIRMDLYKRRVEQRKAFERVVSKWRKLGFTTDAEESFLNGRKVIAIFSEHKRQVKGILLGESETRKTTFVEPEETIELNNIVFSLELDEAREVQKILQQLTSHVSAYQFQLNSYYNICGQFDFINAKAKLAIEMDAYMPIVEDKSTLTLESAYHPILFLYNKKLGKKTIPTTLTLDNEKRILVISGPNAGGKTITMKTIGLVQLMMQSGLLVPVGPGSIMGIFKQLLIHIGDMQSIEFELSTYSSHLKNMKFFLENANGRTLFLIDELGGGTDPNLGGSFAEAMLETLIQKHSIGVVTTHYMNLKILASQTKGLINGSMAFDEKNLMPLYKLSLGKPGSSYTFSIAERIGLDKKIINRAKQISNVQQFDLDKLLNNTEQDLQKIQADKADMQTLLQEQERMNAELRINLNKEKHRQEVEKLKLKNKITEERLQELKDTERKIKQAVFEWKNSKNKSEAITNMENLLFFKKAVAIEKTLEKKFAAKYKVVGGDLKVGCLVRMKSTNQVAFLKEIGSNNKATIQLGLLPVNIDKDDLEVVEERNAVL
jgi:DNA mismatch repair protein MutS2